MAIKVKDTDKGYKRLLQAAKMQKTDITVGIHAAEGQKEHQDYKASVLDIATFHEFGLGVPERSFVRAWFDAKKPDVQAFVVSRLKLVVAGKLTQDQALDQIGLFMQSGMQKNISDGIPPPNAPSTIARKGSSTPLIDTGQLRSSITYAVNKP